MDPVRVLICLLWIFLVPIQTTSAQEVINVLNLGGYSRVGSAFWGSGGAGIAQRGMPGAALENPALLSFHSTTVMLESSWRPKTEYPFNASYDRTFQIPSIVSIGLPINSGSVEVGYSRTYDERIDFGMLQVTTESQPDGTGQTINAIITAMVHTGFAAISYTVPEGVTLGMTAGIDFLQYDNAMMIGAPKGSGSRLRLAWGIASRLLQHVNAGLDVRTSLDTDLKYSTTPTPLDSIFITAAFLRPVFRAKSPTSVSVGVAVETSPAITVLASAEFQNWSVLDTHYDDRWQFHIGMIDSVSGPLAIRAGFFTCRTPVAGAGDLFDQYFLTAGLTWRFSESLTASMTYMTSELFGREIVSGPYHITDKSLRQKMLSGGVSYSW